MAIPGSARKILLTAHVSSSVGWFGAVGGFLALAIVGLTSGNPSLARGAYWAMDLSTWYVIVPLALLSVLTGVISSLGTMWGLFRHYWVLVKLLITLVCSAILAIHMRPIELLAAGATRARLIDASLHLRCQCLSPEVSQGSPSNGISKPGHAASSLRRVLTAASSNRRRHAKK